MRLQRSITILSEALISGLIVQLIITVKIKNKKPSNHVDLHCQTYSWNASLNIPQCPCYFPIEVRRKCKTIKRLRAYSIGQKRSGPLINLGSIKSVGSRVLEQIEGWVIFTRLIRVNIIQFCQFRCENSFYLGNVVIPLCKIMSGWKSSMFGSRFLWRKYEKCKIKLLVRFYLIYKSNI